MRRVMEAQITPDADLSGEVSEGNAVGLIQPNTEVCEWLNNASRRVEHDFRSCTWIGPASAG
jgi:hypothetical protein